MMQSSINERIENNMGLVYSVVKKFTGRGVEFDDLVQIGALGLTKAAQNYDESTGYQFSTYAVPMIMGEIKRYLRDDGMIKISRKIKENAIKIRYAKDKLAKKKGQEPSLLEISEDTGISVEDIVEALDAVVPHESLYAQTNDDGGYVLDTIADKTSSEDAINDKILVKDMLQSLDKRSRQVIILRYFKEETQQQIAKKLGISQVQVSRIEKKILQSLRKQIG